MCTPLVIWPYYLRGNSGHIREVWQEGELNTYTVKFVLVSILAILQRVASVELGHLERNHSFKATFTFPFQLIVQRQEQEQELQQRLQKLGTEKQGLQERVASLQRTLGGIETEKRETERAAVRLEKDKNALKKTLDKVCTKLQFSKY